MKNTLLPISICFFLGLMLSVMTHADNCKALIVVGMEDERAIAAGDDVQVVVGAANASLLQQRLNVIDTRGISAVYSFGVAGGLNPALKSGDLLVSSQVLMQSTKNNLPAEEKSWFGDADMLAAIMLQAEKSVELKIRKGIFLGSDLEARDNPETGNKDLWTATGADIIDNESHMAARFASEHQLPFVSVRAVSDSVNNPLPPAALIALDVDGSPNGTAIAKSILMHPGQIPALIRTAREYSKALNSLKKFRQHVGFNVLESCR